MLSVTIGSKEALYEAYMPFIRGGGLFIPTRRKFSLGDEVFVLLSLSEGNEKLPIPGRVVWVTPAAAQSRPVPGVGVAINDPSGATRLKIEALLAGLRVDRPTQTM